MNKELLDYGVELVGKYNVLDYNKQYKECKSIYDARTKLTQENRIEIVEASIRERQRRN